MGFAFGSTHPTLADTKDRSGQGRRPRLALPDPQAPVSALARFGKAAYASRRGDVISSTRHFFEEQTRWGRYQREEPMGSKRTSRRDLLRGGAALAGGLTLGVPVPRTRARPLDGLGIGQRKRLSDDPVYQGDDRLRRALSLRDLGAHTAPDGQQGFARRVREGVPRGLAVAGSCWQHHAIVAPLYRDDPPVLPSGHRSQAAHFDDPRPGGSAADLHHGRPEALPISQPVAFPRMRGKSAHSANKGPCRNRTG